MFSKLPEGIDCEQIRRLQRCIDPFVLAVRPIATHGLAQALSVIKKTEWLAVAAAFPAQPLLHHHRTAADFIDCEVISDQRVARLAVFDLDRDRALTAAGFQLLGPTTLIPGATEAQLETFRQKANTSNTVDLPLPFGPSSTVSGVSSLNSTSCRARKLRTLSDSIRAGAVAGGKAGS